MELQQLVENLSNIYINSPRKTLFQLETIYHKLIIYNNDIKQLVPKELYYKYKNGIDNIIYEIFLGDINYLNEIVKNSFIILNELINYLKELFVFNEDQFISTILTEYYKQDYLPIFCIFLDEFLEKYTNNNTIDYNKFIINNFSTVDEALSLFQYYELTINFTETKLNYAELAFIVLYHKYHDIICKIIKDDYDSGNDTDES